MELDLPEDFNNKTEIIELTKPRKKKFTLRQKLKNN